ncbi:hypothetical protein [Streptomyces tirandamycinicus]|uniref:Uncharacterized protein n=1 Tax=Streptomyces tirandamycinicus TaxID=2174846 RepID=A0A2S1T240_9ACTN|nr:hypothetical protein [Streptomyces tirandamycinicus]AWI32691.1 hypothetical protein DDW44_30715 [Streptomyces tirandamycinicus]
MNLNGPLVSIAPVGTDPDDSAAWTPIGGIADVQFDQADADAALLGSWRAAVVSFAMPVRLIRHLMPMRTQCAETLRVIEEHAQRKHIGLLLSMARAQTALLPCPRPF